MEELIQRSYEAIKARGLINDNTDFLDFIEKLKEELIEVIDSETIYNLEKTEYYLKKYIEELIDLSTVCFMQIKHLGYNPIDEFEKVVIKNEKRAKELEAARNKKNA